MSTRARVSSAFMTGLAVMALVLIFVARPRVGSAAEPASRPPSPIDAAISNNAGEMIEQGRRIFRFDTFGSEAFWGDALGLHKAIAGEKNGGVGGGVSPKTALSVGLKVDADALPDSLKQQLKDGKVEASARWVSSAPSATQRSMIPSLRVSGNASTAGPPET
jgi:hypothetical protein